MSKDTTEFILSSDGKIIQRQITETEKILSPEAMNSLATGVVRHIDCIFELPVIGHVTCDINQDCARFHFKVPFLPLKAPYTLREEVLSPSFSAEGEPIFDMRWLPPKDMNLVMVVEVYTSRDIASIGNCYLPAFDNNKRCFRLPIANIYEDSKLCLGEFSIKHPDCQKAVEAAWSQFTSSQYNGDLNLKKIWTQSLFRFKANKESFTQLEPSAPWTALADKISPPILNTIKI